MTDTIASHIHGRRLRTKMLGAAALGASLLFATAVMAGSGQTAGATKTKGHWAGGGTGMYWTTKPDKPYVVNPPLSEATKARMAKGHWAGGGTGMYWTTKPDKPYEVQPQLSEATKARMAKGHWAGGGWGMHWVPGK